MAFEFDENTAFEGHKGDSPAPKRRGGRKPKAADGPKPEESGDNVVTAPGAATPQVVEPPPKKPGLPRTGKYKPRPYRPERWGKGRKWATSGEWVPKFLRAYARTGNIGHAAYIAGVARQTVGNWKDRDPEFSAACEDAFEWHKAQFDDEARRRAMEGDEILVQDKKTGEWVTIKQKNPLYFFFYGKRIIPEYRDSYKPEDEDAKRQGPQVVVNYLQAVAKDDAPEALTFDEFKAIEAKVVESKDERRARLLAELALLDAEGADGDHDRDPGDDAAEAGGDRGDA